MKLRLAAALVVLAAPAQAEAPDNHAAAERLVSDLGGFANIARGGVQTMINAGIIESPDLYRKVYKQYLEDHADLIARADGEMAAVFVQIYTADDLRAYIAYEESPLGHAIMQKQFAASQTLFSDHYQPAVLTDEEKAAQEAFYTSPEGKNLSHKFAQMLGNFMTQVAPYVQQITAGATEEYCNQGGDCSKLRIVHPGESLTPKP
jgi:hypothetical protein